MKTMKKLILLGTLFIVTLGSVKATHTPVTIISTTDAFIYIKVSKAMIGGVLEIKNERDSVVETINVDHHKMYVDFYYKNSGKYKVCLKNKDIVVQFGYTLCDVKAISAEAPGRKHSKG
jgi:hypothetical protein